ncbi:hypothetical protein BSQ39_06055 [Loigolactobacillus backii]|uniref:TIGR01906 family membrane protein n=1 Tax=Loigolactobacillus backii TaxID=375175 RepID=UPI000C1C8B08|nr:TIGR01906 family membrane protein [Loigolactobacillus backii]PIO83170.1 hypothetical protein BSQ39_06055 [Loigolactobacillus backii]
MGRLMLWRAGRFLNWLGLFLWLLSLTIILTFASTWLYRFDIHYFEILKGVPMTTATLMKNYHQMLSYVTLPWVHNLHMTDFESSFAGTLHFTDVRHLVFIDYAVFLVTSVTSWLFLRFLHRKRQLWQLIRPFQFMMGIPFVVLFLLAMNFQTFFTDFHKLLFQNSDWLFDPNTDPIILVLPEGFFMHCFILAIILLEVFLLIGVLVGKRALEKSPGKIGF